MEVVDSYELSYIETIKNGLENTSFKVNSKLATRENFFQELVDLTITAKKVGGRLFFIGNGASAAFANHMALDWSKNGGLYSTSLSDSALLTALSNDYSYEMAFVEFLRIAGANKNDLVVTISSSGNSINILNVLKYCNILKIKTIGLSGLNNNNQTTLLADFSLFVPNKTYGMVECIHQIFLHLWLDKSMDIFDWQRNESQNMNSKDFKL